MSEPDRTAAEPSPLRLDADGIPILEEVLEEVAADPMPASEEATEAIPLLIDRAGLERLAAEVAAKVAAELAREFEAGMRRRLEQELLGRLLGDEANEADGAAPGQICH
jgi:hypothetical protein